MKSEKLIRLMLLIQGVKHDQSIRLEKEIEAIIKDEKMTYFVEYEKKIWSKYCHLKYKIRRKFNKLTERFYKTPEQEELAEIDNKFKMNRNDVGLSILPIDDLVEKRWNNLLMSERQRIDILTWPYESKRQKIEKKAFLIYKKKLTKILKKEFWFKKTEQKNPFSNL